MRQPSLFILTYTIIGILSDALALDIFAIKSQLKGNWCLESDSFKKLEPLKLRKCSPSLVKQYWYFDDLGQIRSIKNEKRCLSKKKNSLVISQCRGKTNTKWKWQEKTSFIFPQVSNKLVIAVRLSRDGQEVEILPKNTVTNLKKKWSRMYEKTLPPTSSPTFLPSILPSRPPISPPTFLPSILPSSPPKPSPTSLPSTSQLTFTPTETCNNLNTNCDYWESQGYCTHSYVEYMTINCRKSCRLCTSQTNPPAVTPTATPTSTAVEICNNLNANCDYWESQGYCTHSYVAYMAINCRKSCRLCTLAPTPEPLLKRTGLSCESNSDCKSGYCDEATKICYETDKCKAIRHSPFSEFRKNKVIVVIVGSGFTDLTVWKNQAATVFSRFEQFPFFEASVDEYVAFYVNELNDPFCYYGCFSGTAVDRLLCCEVRAARTLGDMCFPYVSGVQTVVVHNDLKYGGAGQLSDDIATTSIASSAPLVAVHELGHTLFNFQDEYNWDYSGTDRGPNCDSTPGCPRWNDILESYPNACTYKGCGGSNYWISEPSSFMRVLNTNVGPVLRRFTCCTYLAITGQIPLYCNEFLNLGDGLINFCQASGYINDQTLLPKNEIIESSEEVCSEGSSIFLPSRKFICITSSTIRLILDVFSLDESVGELSILSSQILESGYIPSSQIYGDYENESSVSEAGEDNVIKINITSASGVTETRLYSAFVLISAPPLHETALDGALAVKLKRASIEIVVDKAQWDDGIQVSGKLSQVLPHFLI